MVTWPPSQRFRHTSWSPSVVVNQDCPLIDPLSSRLIKLTLSVWVIAFPRGSKIVQALAQKMDQSFDGFIILWYYGKQFKVRDENWWEEVGQWECVLTAVSSLTVPSSFGCIFLWLYPLQAVSSSGCIFFWLYLPLIISSSGCIFLWLYHHLTVSSSDCIFFWLFLLAVSFPGCTFLCCIFLWLYSVCHSFLCFLSTIVETLLLCLHLLTDRTQTHRDHEQNAFHCTLSFFFDTLPMAIYKKQTQV